MLSELMLRCCCVSLPGNVKKRLVDLALPLFQESEDEKLLVEQPGNMSRDVQPISGFCWIAVIVVCLHIDIHRSRFEHILSVSLYVGVVIVADRTMLWHVAATAPGSGGLCRTTAASWSPQQWFITPRNGSFRVPLAAQCLAIENTVEGAYNLRQSQAYTQQ